MEHRDPEATKISLQGSTDLFRYNHVETWLKSIVDIQFWEEALSFPWAEEKAKKMETSVRGEGDEKSIHERRSIGPERKIRSNEFRDITLTKALFLGSSFFSLREEKVERTATTRLAEL